MAPQCRPPTLLLLALAGLLLLTQAAPAAAARRAERKLLQAPVLRPSDTTKAATVDPAPAPPPGDPSLTLPGGAEKCAAPAPPSQRTGSSQPAAQEGSAPLEAPDITAGASTKSTLPAPSRTTKCLTPARPPTWEEWAVWLADKDEQLQVIMQDCKCTVRDVVKFLGYLGTPRTYCKAERETFCPTRPCAVPESCLTDQFCLDDLCGGCNVKCASEAEIRAAVTAIKNNAPRSG